MFFFLLPLTVFFGYIEYRLSQLPNSYKQKKQLFEQNAASTEVLVLGSSQALYGIDPGYFSHKGFNLANVSQTIYYDKRLTLSNLDKMKKLKLVILPIAEFSLYRQLQNDKIENWRDYFYYRFWHIRYKTLPVFTSKNYSYIALYTRDQAVKYLRSNFKQGAENAMEQNGYEKNDSAGHLFHISDSLGADRAAYHKSTYNKAEEAYVINDIDDLAAELSKRGIKLIFISLPVYRTYYDHCDRTDFEHCKGIIGNIAAKYSLKYYDYFTDNRFNIDDFADNDHLSFVGAAKLSKIIDSEIIRTNL